MSRVEGYSALMAKVKANTWNDLDIEIEYETFGNPNDPALLLVMGFTAQLIAWDVDFCQLLADRGRYVIRFDNRDCGLSTKLHGVEVDAAAFMNAGRSPDPKDLPTPPYTLSDFSNDAFGLLTALGIEQAHILGASMGGMIVQTMAIEHPERVLSLTSVMSSTGEPGFGGSTKEASQALLAPAKTKREEFIAQSVERGAIFSPHKHFNPDASAQLAAAAFDRSFYPEGVVRQLTAIRGSGHRGDGLKKLAMPTLVIHGRMDPIIQLSGGDRTAELIPGAKLLVFNDMGHDTPRPLWPQIVDAVISHTQLP